MSKTRKEDAGLDPQTEVPPKERPKIRAELIEELMAAAGGPGGLTGPDGLLSQLTSALVNRALDAELSDHLGYESGEEVPEEQSNRRNGKRVKTVRTKQGHLKIEVPRDREGSFEPKLVGKYKRDFDGFDDQILSMYGRGLTTRDIKNHLQEIYGVEVSPELVSRVTDAVIDELREWQTRPLESIYAVVYIDALVVKIRDQGRVENKAVHVVVGVDREGARDVLGLWIARTEGAKYWSTVLADLKHRGVEDILILCADGLAGIQAAVEANFPKTIFQTCIVHMVRASTRYVSYKDLRGLCRDLRTIYGAANEEGAIEALGGVEKKWGEQYPEAIRPWRTRREEWTPFLAFPAELRRMVYTTNAIEALNRILRKVLKTRGALPTEEAALKLLYLAIANAKKTWGRQATNWSVVRRQLALHFDQRFTHP